MDTSLDLVDHFKLEAEQLPEYTQHTHYKSDRSHGLRKLKVVKRWRKKHDIGEGGFGIVWLEVEEDGSERAVKAISRRLCSYSKIDYRKELAAMAILSKYEELFVAFQGWFEGPEHIFVAMEYFKHGDLQRHMETKMPEIQNIFVVDTDPNFWVKIGDFGITKRILNEQTFLRTEVGTPDYLAPEVLGYVEEETSRYTNAVDLWSLGCICHRLLTMESPFPKTSALWRYCLGMTELPIEALYKSTVTEEAITLVKDLMNAQPSERINAEAALHSLWLKDVESLDCTFTVQSKSRLTANTDDDLAVRDAEMPQDSKLPETSNDTWKKRREALYIETPSTSKNGQSTTSAVLLRPALEHHISSNVSKQQEGTNSISINNSIAISPSALGERDPDALSLKSFLDAGFDLENYSVESQGYAVKAFEWAARQPKTDCLKLLLRNSRMIDVTESLSWAVRENVLIAVQAIVESTHTDINRPSYNGLTLLHLACMHGHEKIARYLVEKGAIVNACDTSGITSLHLASLADRKARGPIAELLEGHGALKGHIPLTSAPAITELMLSRSGRNSARNLFKLRIPENLPFETPQELPVELLSRDIEYLAARFRMAGHYPHVLALADHAFRWAAKEDSQDLMVYVLAHGVPVDINALLRSAEVKNNPKAIALLSAKREVTDPLHFFTHPLHIACFYGQLGNVVAVLDLVPSMKEILRSKDHRGRTALHRAVSGRGEKKDGERQELVNMLLTLGADPIQRDMRGRTALFLANLDHNEMIPALKAASKGMKYPVSTLEEAFSELEIMETSADIKQASLSDDDEVSSLKSEVSLGDETGNGSNKAEKVDGPKQSWWRSLLSPEAHLKSRKRMGTDRLGGDPLSRREDDLHKAAQEGRLGAKYFTYDHSTGGIKTVIMRPG